MQEVMHSLLLVAGSWEVTVIRHVWALPGTFGSGSGRVDVLPGESEQQCMVLGFSALFFDNL